MPSPDDFNPENERIPWHVILMVFAIQMVVLVAVSISPSLLLVRW